MEKISQRHGGVRRLRWARVKDYLVHELPDKALLLVIQRCSHGWRIFGRFKRLTYAVPYDLCYILSRQAVLFPSARSAIKAAELFALGQQKDLPMVWIHRDGSCYSVSGNKEEQQAIGVSTYFS
jgi:hypothetical protein